MAVDVQDTSRPEARAPDRPAWRNRRLLAELHREHGDGLVAFLTSRTGDRELAQDLAQETMVRAADHLDELDTDRPVWPWLKTIASNLVVDHHRKHRREHLTDDVDIHHEPDGYDPVEISLERDLLAEALADLTDRHRLAIELRYLEQWKAAEACELFGLTRAAFEQLLFRARTNLRDAYQALTDQPGRFAGLLLAPLARLKTSLATRIRARFAGLEESLQTMGPTALDVVGQAAATFAILGLAVAVAGNSPASADFAIEGSTTANSLDTFFDAPTNMSASAEAPTTITATGEDGAPTPAEATATKRHVELESPSPEGTTGIPAMSGVVESVDTPSELHLDGSVSVTVVGETVEYHGHAWVPCPDDHLVYTPTCEAARTAAPLLP